MTTSGVDLIRSKHKPNLVYLEDGLVDSYGYRDRSVILYRHLKMLGVKLKKGETKSGHFVLLEL